MDKTLPVPRRTKKTISLAGYVGAAYLGSILLLSLWSIAQIATSTGEVNWVWFSILLLLACASTPLNVKLPGVDRSLSLSFLFTFSSILVLPPSAAFYIASVAFVFGLLVEEEEEQAQPWHTIAFNVASLAICVHLSSLVYSSLHERGEVFWAWTGAAWAAAGTYYCVISATSALRIAIEERTFPWRVWRRRFFWTGPVYMLAPVGHGAVRLVIQANTYVESLAGLLVIAAGYAYVRIYFSRLHDQQDHDRELAEIRNRGIETLAAAIEAKDGNTAGHLRRVKAHAMRLARTLGCTEEEIPTLEMAAVLHDVGKVGIPDYILMKPGRLTEHEFREISHHTTLGADIVDSARFPSSVGEVVRSHHEHWDGSGYPQGLSGEEIPFLARILTVVDCFDALVTDRPYRPALSIDKAVDLMRQQRGRIFDPAILDTFLDEVPNFLSELKRDLEQERADAAHDDKPVSKISQTWISEEAEHGASLRQQRLNKLTQSPDKLLAYYEILNVLGADLNFEKSLTECLRMLRSALPFDKAGIFVLENDHYLLLSAQGIPDHCLSRLSLPAEHGLVAHAAISRAPVIADAPPSQVPGERPPRYLDDVGSTLAAPLIVEERVLGCLVLCSAKPGAFDQEQATSLDLITGKLARTLMSSRAVQKVYLEAETDPVTGLPNARAAFRKLEDEIKRAQREALTVGVLFMDINGLKPVNDSYGHGAGDQLLVETARKLKDRLRTYDFVGRVGGDEFLAILPGVSPDGLPATVESLKKAIAETAVKVAQGVYAQTTMSIGASIFPEDGADSEDLVYLADQRMYEDKQRSRSSKRQREELPSLVGQVGYPS